jgi:hypothetical protein
MHEQKVIKVIKILIMISFISNTQRQTLMLTERYDSAQQVSARTSASV